jgi:hypothetical protein
MFHITLLCDDFQRIGGFNHWEVFSKGSAPCDDVPNVGRASVSDTISGNLRFDGEYSYFEMCLASDFCLSCFGYSSHFVHDSCICATAKTC